MKEEHRQTRSAEKRGENTKFSSMIKFLLLTIWTPYVVRAEIIAAFSRATDTQAHKRPHY